MPFNLIKKERKQRTKGVIKRQFRSEEYVILVDKKDKEIGRMEKTEAHKRGLLHRAFSVLLYNDKGEMLIQKRNKNKYHSGGLWSNAACGHPKAGEEIIKAAEKRLWEEMGIKTKLEEKFVLNYKIQFENGLWENEIDHVLSGCYKGDKIKPDLNEAEDWKWIKIKELKNLILLDPDAYTYWFKKIISKL